VRVDPAHSERQAWKEYPGAGLTRRWEEFLVAGGKPISSLEERRPAELEFASSTKRDANHRIADLGKHWSLVEKALLSGHAEDDEVFIRFESYATPAMVYSISRKRTDSHLARSDLPGVEPSRYAVDSRVLCTKDGTRVPMFVVTPARRPLMAFGPVIMTAYGGFALAIAPSFYPANYTWVERRGVFVQVAARGGLEYGEACTARDAHEEAKYSTTSSGPQD